MTTFETIRGDETSSGKKYHIRTKDNKPFCGVTLKGDVMINVDMKPTDKEICRRCLHFFNVIHILKRVENKESVKGGKIK